VATWDSDRGRIAALTRAVRNGERPADDPELLEARRNFTAKRLAEHVETKLAESPPLTDAQLDSIAAILEAARAGAR
jgi:hypothetical protein